MITALIISGLLLLTVVPLPGGSIVARLGTLEKQPKKTLSPVELLQEAALSDPVALEALREADAVLPSLPPLEPREKLAAIAEEKRVAEEAEARGIEDTKRAVEMFHEEVARRKAMAIQIEEQKRLALEGAEKAQREYAAARAETFRLASSPEIPAIAYRPLGGKPVLVEEIETTARLKRELDRTWDNE